MRTCHRGVRLLAAWGMVAAAGCALPWSAPDHADPVAVRATSSGEIEVLLVPCSSARVARFEVTAPREVVQRAGDLRVWQVDFSPPATDLRRVVLRDVPPGGTERVPWPAAGLAAEDADFGYVVRVVLDNGDYWHQGFSPPRDLTDGRVMFHDRPVSPEAFADQHRCPDPNASATAPQP
ncbi:MAG: hypothetical protein ACRDYX_05440 [Egibacteraceae bacterium]